MDVRDAAIVLAAMDGKGAMSLLDISSASGMGSEACLGILERMKDLRLIGLKWFSSPLGFRWMAIPYFDLPHDVRRALDDVRAVRDVMET